MSLNKPLFLLMYTVHCGRPTSACGCQICHIIRCEISSCFADRRRHFVTGYLHFFRKFQIYISSMLVHSSRTAITAFDALSLGRENSHESCICPLTTFFASQTMSRYRSNLRCWRLHACQHPIFQIQPQIPSWKPASQFFQQAILGYGSRKIVSWENGKK